MPIRMNCGLSKKVADNNYGSRGASINLEVEVESSLADNPAALKDRIRRVFGLVRESLAEELNGQVKTASQVVQNSTTSNNGQKPAQPRLATQSQIRAITAIAKRLQVNVENLLSQRFQVTRPQDLSIKQASQFIEELNKEG